jgi:plastocyanin
MNLALLFSLFILSLGLAGSAYSIEQPEKYLPPLICIMDIEPGLYGGKEKEYLAETKNGIQEWKVHLQQLEHKNNKWYWDMSVKVIHWNQENFDEDCTLGVSFFYKPENVEKVSDVLGEFWREPDGFSRINIYVGDIGYEVTSWADANYRYFRYEPVYSGYIVTQQLGNIVRHELGHFLGLDHIFDSTGGTSPHASSIMTPNVNVNPYAQQIRPRDINAVKALYPNGFADKSWIFRNTVSYPNLPEDSSEHVAITTKGCKNDMRCFIPDSVEIPVNGTVKWINDDTEPHTIFASRGDGTTAFMQKIEPGRFVVIQFLEDGLYFIESLDFTYMQGQVTVEKIKEVSAAKSSDDPIPDWVRNSARWWSANQITDSDFAKGLEFLIKEKIIKIPEGTPSIGQAEKNIPGWLRKNAGWWSQGLISDEEFLKSIQYLINVGIIKL